MIDPSQFTSPISRGDAPMTPAQFARRMRAALERIMPTTAREQLLSTDPDTAAQLGAALSAVQAEAVVNNTFNHQLVAYRGAVARLARYRLAEGRGAIYEDQLTGAVDPETGDAITESVLTSSAIDPLPATVAETTYDSETGEVTGDTEVPNPAIIQDDAERAEAQAVIDGTPQEVIEFDAE